MKLLVAENAGKAGRLLEVIRKAGQAEEWEVISCEGHYAGLSPSSLGFDPKKEFSPSWKSRNTKVLKKVQASIEKADEVYAATDFSPDGEAIANQISVTADRLEKPFFRLTKSILGPESFVEAVSSPGALDEPLLNSFLAREFLDRLVRFRLGDTMEARLGTKSIERLPSLILCELARRERKVRRFVPEEVLLVRALLENGSFAESGPLDAPTAEEIVRRCKAAEPAYQSAFEKAEPPAPFVTSSLLQFLSSRYGFDPQKAMHMCQTLYGLGYITSPHTDSLYVDEGYLASVLSFASHQFGDEYIEEEPRTFAAAGPAQQEAIRPVDIKVVPSKSNIRGDLRTVYQAIWFNSLASQGLPALIERQQCDYRFFGSPDTLFTAFGVRLSSPGWHQLSSRLFLDQGQELHEEGLAVVEASQVLVKSTPPLRHDAASIISWLDEKLVGRPHNYASSIRFLFDENYVESMQGRLKITTRGEALVSFLKRACPDLLDADFHAEVEEEIDSVAAGDVDFLSFAKDYWSWAEEAEAKMVKASLRPKFKAPGGSKTKVWIDKNRVYAFSASEGWSTPIEFDAKGRILPQA